MELELKTSILEGDRILQVINSGVDGVVTEMMRTVYDTREKQLREALISLGWTPPKETS